MTPLLILDILPDGTATKAHLTSALPEKGYRWVSGAPDDAQLADWAGQNLPPLANHALFQPETRPRTVKGDGGTAMILRGVNLNPKAEVEDMISVRCWSAPHLIVTLRFRNVMALRALEDYVVTGQAPTSPEDFLNQLSKELIDRIETVSLDLNERANTLEDRVFDDIQHTTPDITELAQLRRKVIQLRRYVGPSSHALSDAARLVSDAPALQLAFGETANRATRSLEELDAVRDRLTVLTDHINIEQASRQQTNSYLLSMVATVFLPISFLTGLFGVNVAGMPGIDWPMAFWSLSALTVGLAVLLAIFLRWRHWF